MKCLRASHDGDGGMLLSNDDATWTRVSTDGEAGNFVKSTSHQCRRRTEDMVDIEWQIESRSPQRRHPLFVYTMEEDEEQM